MTAVTDFEQLLGFPSNGDFDENLSAWETSTVTSMSYMFYDAFAFTNGGQPLAFDTSRVTDMSYTFTDAIVFDQTLSWDTGAVTDMSMMFTLATNFTGDLSAWDMRNVTNMQSMFSGASAFAAAGCGAGVVPYSPLVLRAP